MEKRLGLLKAVVVVGRVNKFAAERLSRESHKVPVPRTCAPYP